MLDEVIGESKERDLVAMALTLKHNYNTMQWGMEAPEYVPEDAYCAEDEDTSE